MAGQQTRTSGQDGAISIMAAVLAVAMIMATSLAVDVGRVAYSSRDQQGVTDRAVLDALRRLGDDLPETATTPDQIWAVVSDSVASTLGGNRESSSEGTSSERVPEIIEIGYTDASCVYDPTDPQPDHPEDFCVVYSQDGAGPYYSAFDPAPGVGEDITTVRVVTESAVDFVFAFLDEDGARDVIKAGLGTNRRECSHPTDPGCPPPAPPCVTPSDLCPLPEQDTLVDAEAGISVRSRLLELDSRNSELLDQLLGDLLGGPVDVTAIGFDGLADAVVPLGVVGDAGANVGSVDQLLDSEVTLAGLLTAMAGGATSEDAAVQAAARSALTDLAATVDPAIDVAIGDLLAATTEDVDALLRAEFNALDLVMQATMAAAVADGTHLVTLDLAGSDLLGLDGLLDVDAGLSLIEAPQSAYGPVRYDDATGRYETRARTAQVDLTVSVRMERSAVESLLGPTLTGLLTDILCILPLVCPSTQSLTIDLAVAQAEAELAGIRCVDPTTETDLTTIVTSDAVTAEVDDEVVTLWGARDSSTSTVLIPEVPGEGAASVSDSSLSDSPLLDSLLTPLFDVLGVGTGTAYVSAYAVDCDVPVLMENPVATP